VTSVDESEDEESEDIEDTNNSSVSVTYQSIPKIDYFAQFLAATGILSFHCILPRKSRL
jgi:hypothetical protein